MSKDQPGSNEPAGKLEFRSSLPDFPEGRPVNFAEVELLLKARIVNSLEDDLEALYQLSVLYSRSGRPDQAEKCITKLLKTNQEPGGAALHLFQLGQLGERHRDYDAAATYYWRGLEAGPVSPLTSYFLRNNLGYSLNQLDRFSEAEPLLREAIQVDPEKPNAYKNLGLCQWGLGRLVEAATSFIEGTRMDAADGRSLDHLKQLFREHPEIANEIPGFDTLLTACREAVVEAARHWPDLEAWWRKSRKDAEAGSNI